MTKICTQCEVEKPIDDFYRQKSGKLGRHSFCKKCFDAKHTRKRVYDPDKNRQWNVRTRYGITCDQVSAMIEKQGGVCPICGEKLKKYRIDHDHKTGAVRGALCHRCNILIAGIEDEVFK